MSIDGSITCSFLCSLHGHKTNFLHKFTMPKTLHFVKHGISILLTDLYNYTSVNYIQISVFFWKISLGTSCYILTLVACLQSNSTHQFEGDACRAGLASPGQRIGIQRSATLRKLCPRFFNSRHFASKCHIHHNSSYSASIAMATYCFNLAAILAVSVMHSSSRVITRDQQAKIADT